MAAAYFPRRCSLPVYRALLAVFGLTLANVQAKAAFLQSCGLRVPRVLNRHPAVLGLRRESMERTLAFLASLDHSALGPRNTRSIQVINKRTVE